MSFIAGPQRALLKKKKLQFTLRATTTGASDTVEIARLTPKKHKTLVVRWGDGETTYVYAGDETPQQHTYALADTYTITITNARDIIGIGIFNQPKLSGFDTAQLKWSSITYFSFHYVGSAIPCVIRTADMANWSLTHIYLSNILDPNLLYFDSADMVGFPLDYFGFAYVPAAGGNITFDSVDFINMPLTRFVLGAYGVVATHDFRFDSEDFEELSLTWFYLDYLPAGSDININSSHMVNWLLTEFQLSGLPVGTYALDSADMVNWSVEYFSLSSPPAGTYAFDSADMADWRPTSFSMWGCPAGSYSMDSSHMVDWRPNAFTLDTMPSGTYAFDTADMVDWRPDYFYCYDLTGGTLVLDTDNLSAWNPIRLRTYLFGANLSLTVTASDLNGWVQVNQFYIHDNALSQNQVNEILEGLYGAFASRTGSNGTINVGGTNAAPSGTLQAQCPPVDGKEFAYELKNDSCGVSSKHWSTVTITA